MTPSTIEQEFVTRREAVKRVTALLGGVALVGGSSLITGCRDQSSALGKASTFSAEDIAFLDEVAETILPATKTPGAKAAKTGAFMALMVTDTYDPKDQQRFRDGMRALDDASMNENKASFVTSTPDQRLALLRKYDAEQKAHSDAREADRRKKALARLDQPVDTTPPAASDSTTKKPSDAFLPDQRKEAAVGAEAITSDTPAHWFRMMKELALLGYFTSEIGMTQAQQYVESPGKFEPCVPYVAGERSWAGHA